MTLRHSPILLGIGLLAACNQPRQTEAPPQANAVVPPAPMTPQAPQEPVPTAPPQAPPAPPAVAPPAEPADASTDSKGTDAALDVARQFAELLTQRKFDQAYAMLGGRGGFATIADFKRQFAPYSGLSVTILDTPPPQPEGAAGSIYLSVPVGLIGTVDGRHVEHPATLTLRRVNDVPGSTEAQRRWHVEGFDTKTT